jgi:hypothetical protein
MLIFCVLCLKGNLLGFADFTTTQIQDALSTPIRIPEPYSIKEKSLVAGVFVPKCSRNKSTMLIGSLLLKRE